MSQRLRGGVSDDDHAGFGRPGRGSRPRTKDRPDYSKAAEAVAAYDARLDPVLCLTKEDLAPADELIAAYAPLDIPIVAVRPGADLSELRELLHDRVSVFVGHSGVGKSTLVNALIPGVDRAIGEVNEVTGRGRHTSTAAIALELPEHGGWVIDTPGVRSFGLSHVTPASIVAAFPDLAELTAGCPRGCTHASGVPECALDEAVAQGRLASERLESFRRMEGAWLTVRPAAPAGRAWAPPAGGATDRLAACPTRATSTTYGWRT
ncbi:MAG: ribosome small subunit-dependent GTPase A [Micropruina sp.]|nr:ribosome small subunit-dependent GTPase A [Micropruina sp.]